MRVVGCGDGSNREFWLTLVRVCFGGLRMLLSFLEAGVEAPISSLSLVGAWRFLGMGVVHAPSVRSRDGGGELETGVDLVKDMFVVLLSALLRESLCRSRVGG